MTLRLYLDQPLREGEPIELEPGAARHVQVRRLQPGDALVLFNGHGGEWAAQVSQMGRQRVQVVVGAFDQVHRELPRRITLALGMPANDRMDALIEKATELGVAQIQPLLCERSVLRLEGERAQRKREHWQGVAGAASEQSGRTCVPHIAPVRAFGAWLALPRSGVAGMLSLDVGTTALREWPLGGHDALLLSGPEGGLSPGEQAAARDVGFASVNLGARVLRADTAPLAALAWIALQLE